MKKNAFALILVLATICSLQTSAQTQKTGPAKKVEKQKTSATDDSLSVPTMPWDRKTEIRKLKSTNNSLSRDKKTLENRLVVAEHNADSLATEAQIAKTALVKCIATAGASETDLHGEIEKLQRSVQDYRQQRDSMSEENIRLTLELSKMLNGQSDDSALVILPAKPGPLVLDLKHHRVVSGDPNGLPQCFLRKFIVGAEQPEEQ